MGATVLDTATVLDLATVSATEVTPVTAVCSAVTIWARGLPTLVSVDSDTVDTPDTVVSADTDLATTTDQPKDVCLSLSIARVRVELKSKFTLQLYWLNKMIML